MQTRFTDAQLSDPRIAEANAILRKCVHCGFCTATCPTFVLLGDELDSPRGRIYMIKQMLEEGRPATAEVVKHVDRCLSCLSCMTTCPSGVNYMHLIDDARAHIERTYERPAGDRAMRRALAFMLPEPSRMRIGLRLAGLAKPLAGLMRAVPGLGPRLGAMLDLAPASLPKRDKLNEPGVFAAEGERRARVALLAGCAQSVLDPRINTATVRLLNRLGVEVVIPKAAGCCGALTHHLGMEDDALDRARNNVAAWHDEMERDGLDAVIINASGCGTTVKDYGHMLRFDDHWRDKAQAIAQRTMDITEYLARHGLGEAKAPRSLKVTYHSACSMQHGQKITALPKTLLTQAGFTVRDVPEGHLCCGSAGTYNIMQPEIAGKLRDRKLANIASTEPEVIATGNIGCMTQLSGGTDTPIVHTVELLDWATGGPEPEALRR